MQYILNNVKSLNDKNLKKRVNHIVKKQTNRLSRIADNYRKPIVINIFFNQVDNITYQVSALVELREHVLYLKEQDTNIEAAIYKLFDKLKLSITQKIHKEKRNYISRRKRTRLKNFQDNLEHLKDLSQEQTKDTFKKVLKILLNDISRYIKRRVKASELTTELKKGRLDENEILDELYLILFDNIDEIPADIKEINAWLYQKADELLNTKLKEYRISKEKLIGIDNLLKKEIQSFDEQFTADADEKIIPLEELDEFTPENGGYSIYELLFNENEESLIEEITLKIHQDKIQKIIQLELAKLPESVRSIMDLYLNDQLTDEEIAEIKKRPVEEIQKIITSKSSEIKQKLTSIL